MTCSTDYWSELDGDVLRLLAERPGGLSFEEIGHKLGMSEDAVRSIVTMLAQDGKLRIHGGATV
ncbi:MAG TPA: winged helix-turn-helix transcriptional regulator [Methylomirabilota bacterium]|jgi:DNA-binding IclR family transcriptional regulator